MKRRHVVHGLGLAAATTGLFHVPTVTRADVGVADFSASDDSVLTTDGSITAVNVTPTIVVAWAGIGADADLELAIDVENVANGATERIYEWDDRIAETNGERTYELERTDLTETGAFDRADFEAPEDGEVRESDVRFHLDVRVETDDGDTASGTATDVATITVEHRASVPPEIDAFELVDRSNRRWTRVEVDWSVSDVDSDLEDVTTELFVNNELADAESTAVDGATADGNHHLRSRDEGSYEVTITVTDGRGNTTTETGSPSA